MSAPYQLWARLARPSPWTCSRRNFSTSISRGATYGFIGLGRMGYPMAKNLRAKIPKEDRMVIFDVNNNATNQFMKEVGSKPDVTQMGETILAEDVRQVAEQSDYVITSLPEPSHVLSVFSSILASTLPPRTNSSDESRLYIDCSTIDPITSRAIAADVSSSSAGIFVDAPMSGGVVGAEAGTLTFMLGASDNVLPIATAVLKMMGKRVVHLGEQGSGLCGKLANNYLLALNNIATAEAMSMGIRWGVDPTALAGMINTSTGRCWPSEINNPVPGVIATAPASRDYAGGFGISLMSKDLRLAMTAAKEAGVKLALGDLARQVYAEAEKDERCKGRDFSSIYRWLEGPE